MVLIFLPSLKLLRIRLSSEEKEIQDTSHGQNMDAANVDVNKVKQQLSQQVMAQIVTQKVDVSRRTQILEDVTSRF